MDIEWKKICDGEPELNKWYIVASKQGEYFIRYYTLLYTQGLNSKRVIPADEAKNWPWAWKKYECEKQVPFKGFIGSMLNSTLAKQPFYYFELPDLPEQDAIDECRCEIYVLKQKLKRLEAAQH